MDWHDWWRLGIYFLTSWSLIILVARYRKHRVNWNDKTVDYWYSLTMWCLAGWVLALEGILRDSAFGARLIFITLAASITLRGLRQKGSWGGADS